MRSAGGSCGQPSGEFHKQPHARMPKIDPVTVHHRAGTGDHTDVVLTAVLDCVRGDTRSLPHGLVHPSIQTRCTPASPQSRTIRSVASGRVMITTPSTPPGIDCRLG